ncbi:MAG: hypothetical protein ACT4N9_07760 [Paracoccaceae bacterium]
MITQVDVNFPSRLFRFEAPYDEYFNYVYRGVDPTGPVWDIDAYYPDWKPGPRDRHFDPTGRTYRFEEKPKRKKIPTFPHTGLPIVCPKSVYDTLLSKLFDGHVIAYLCKIDDQDYVEIIVTTVVDLIDMEKSIYLRNTGNLIYRFNKIVLRRPLETLPPIFLCGHENRLRRDPIVDQRFVDICSEHKLTGLQFTEVEVV